MGGFEVSFATADLHDQHEGKAQVAAILWRSYGIEVKAENERGDATVEAKKKAVERLRGIQPDKFKYSVMYATDATIESTKIKPVTDWLTA